MRSNGRASHGPRARRLGRSIPAAGCKCQANTAPGLLSPQPAGLKPFVDFCLAVSRRPRPADCFAGYDAAPAARRCGVARSGETAAGIAQHSRLQKSANALQRPSWDLISASLGELPLFGGMGGRFCGRCPGHPEWKRAQLMLRPTPESRISSQALAGWRRENNFLGLNPAADQEQGRDATEDQRVGRGLRDCGDNDVHVADIAIHVNGRASPLNVEAQRQS